MSRAAASVRRRRELHPDEYCPRCMWKIVDRLGNPTPCQRHSPPDSAQVVRGIVRLLTEPSIAERLARFSTERIMDTGIVNRTTFSELWQVTEAGADHRHLVTIRTDDTGRETTECQMHRSGCLACAAVTAARLQNALMGKEPV